MYHLSVAALPRTGRTFDWFSLGHDNNVYVREFDPFSYKVRNTDANRVFSDGGYTSDHYVEPKETIMAATVYGSWAEIRNIMSKLQPKRELIFRWYDTDSSTGVKYLYGKVVDVRAPLTPTQTTGTGQDWTDINVRIKSVDPFIYPDYKLGTFTGQSSPSISDSLAFLTEASATSNALTTTSVSTVDHPPEWLRLRAPTVDGETIVHTLTIPETNTSCSVTFAGDGSVYSYTLWSHFGDRLQFNLTKGPSGSRTSSNDDTLWDGNMPLIPAGGTYRLQHTIQVTVPSGITDPTSRIVLRDPNDPTAEYMSWWVHRLGRIL